MAGLTVEVSMSSPKAQPGEITCRSPLRAWVTKKKSDGARSRILCSANRRFYTLDFVSQVVFYGSFEDSKSVSLPTPFRELISVELTSSMTPPEEGVGSPTGEAPKLQRSDSIGSLSGSRPGSRGSGFLKARMPSLSALTKRPVEQFGVVLQAVSKTSELYFASKAEADSWREAFQWAIDLGAADPARDPALRASPDLSTQPGSRGTTISTPSPRSESDEAAIASAPASARNTGGLGTPPVSPLSAQRNSQATYMAMQSYASLGTPQLTPVSTPAPTALPEAAAPDLQPVVAEPAAVEPAVAAPHPACEEAKAAAPSAKKRGTMMLMKALRNGEAGKLLDTMPEDEAAALPKEEAPGAAEPQLAQLVIPPVDALADVQAASPARPAKAPAAPGAQAWGFGGDGDGEPESAPERHTQQKYSDKGEGLSLQQRLAQLDFSDDEDEDEDDPMKVARVRSARGKKERATKAEDAATKAQVASTPVEHTVIMEACEEFVQDADDVTDSDEE
mmetsp:Transcript_18159/g.63809  ORF Transcript_18159/g.63809 Transcript_18159/m.63809 type:complete len:506 (-) Transcript_18159:34-1551(-)